MRDTQRKKSYTAEDEAFERTEFKGKTKANEPIHLDDIRALIEDVRLNPKLREEGLLLNRVLVHDGRGRTTARGSADTITLPVWARKRWIILHELAHCIVERQRRQAVIAAINARPRHSVDFPHAAHGWLWARTYLRLVRLYLGADAERTLKASFRRHRVKFAPPRPKREYTPEQKLAMGLRLQAAREKKAAMKLETWAGSVTRQFGAGWSS